MSIFEIFAYFATAFFLLSGVLVTWIASEYGLQQRVLSFLLIAGALWAVSVVIFLSLV